jgi:hypothetical protein
MPIEICACSTKNPSRRKTEILRSRYYLAYTAVVRSGNDDAKAGCTASNGGRVAEALRTHALSPAQWAQLQVEKSMPTTRHVVQPNVSYVIVSNAD